MLKNIKEIEMKNISVLIEGGAKTLKLKKPIITYGTRIAAKEVTVFWNFKNITADNDNQKFIITGDIFNGTLIIHHPENRKEITLGEGYWDFQQIKDRLEGEKLILSMNARDNTCTIINNAGSIVNLKKFGKLLGFPEDHKLQKGSTTASPKPVDVNHGLRYLTVTCDLIDQSKNINVDGDESDILAFLPITPGTRLNSNCYVYERDDAWRAAKNAIVAEMEFKVTSNISEKVDVTILLDLALE